MGAKRMMGVIIVLNKFSISVASLELCAGVPEPELRHILPELENSGKNSGRQNYFIFQQTFGIKWEN
jgi:hypothetical protein